jgi:hypothetical protein
MLEFNEIQAIKLSNSMPISRYDTFQSFIGNTNTQISNVESNIKIEREKSSRMTNKGNIDINNSDDKIQQVKTKIIDKTKHITKQMDNLTGIRNKTPENIS